MGITDRHIAEALEWVRFSLHPELPMPAVSDWMKLYEFANKQKIAALCSPSHWGVRMDENTLFRWLNAVQKTRNNSTKLNMRTTVLYEKLSEAGFRCCILKGQGNAVMYPEPLLRCPGDIDVWIDASEQKITDYVRSLFPHQKSSFKHIKFPVFRDVPVDVHHTPLKLYHPTHHRRLQQWLEEQKQEQFSHFVRLPITGAEICVPTIAFNAVYQLGHIMVHLQDEGIGFRHFIDYYYVIKKLGDCSEEEKQQVVKLWKELGMLRLAKAMMWILHDILGLEERYLPVEPSRKLGKIILDEALEGGNFGKYSKRQKLVKYGFLVQKTARTWHYLQLSRCYPSETPYHLYSKWKTIIRVTKEKFK